MEDIISDGKNNKNCDERKTLIDHNTEETTRKTIEIDGWAGIAVYRHIQLFPAAV